MKKRKLCYTSDRVPMLRFRGRYLLELFGAIGSEVARACEAQRRAFERRVKQLMKDGRTRREAKKIARSEQ